MSPARFMTLCVLAGLAIGAMWLPWQQDRFSAAVGPAAAISVTISAWTDFNPFIGVLAAAAVGIGWLQLRRRRPFPTLIRTAAPGFGLLWTCLLFTALVVGKTAAPGIGLGIEVLVFGLMLGVLARATMESTSVPRIRPWRRVVDVAYVVVLLVAVVYVPSDDAPRRGISGSRYVDGTCVAYGLNDSGLGLVVLSGKDLVAGAGGADGDESWWNYSDVHMRDVRVGWTSELAVVGDHQFDLSRGRVLHLSSTPTGIQVTQLSLDTRPIQPAGFFRWSHHGVTDELDRILSSAEGKAAVQDSRDG